MEVQQVASKYRVVLKGMIYDQVERMCQHVRSLGYDNVMIQVGEFLNRRDWYNVNLNDKIHLDFIG